jgi:hypothetical protein
MESWLWLLAVIGLPIVGALLARFIPERSLSDDGPTDPDSSGGDGGHPFIF